MEVCNPAYFCACRKQKEIGRVATGRASGIKMGGDNRGGSLTSLERVVHLILLSSLAP